MVLATIGLAIDMWRRAYRNKHPKPHKAAKPTKKQWKPRACCMDDTTDDTIIDVQIDDRDDLDGLMRALDEPVPPKKKKIKPRPPTEPPLPDPEPSSPSVEDALMRALETPVPVDQPAPPPKKKKIKPRPPLEPPPPPEAEPIEPPPPPAEPSSPSVDDLRRRFEAPRPRTRTWTLCNASWPTCRRRPGLLRRVGDGGRRRRRDRGGVEPAAGGRGRPAVDGSAPRGERGATAAPRACGTPRRRRGSGARGPRTGPRHGWSAAGRLRATLARSRVPCRRYLRE